MRTLEYRRPDSEDHARHHVALPAMLLLFGMPPVFGWASLLIMWVHARVVLGYWPSYGKPDPKSLPPGSSPLAELMPPLVIVLVVWCIGLLVLARFVQARNRALAAGLASMCAWYFGCCACVFDPLGIVNWIMD